MPNPKLARRMEKVRAERKSRPRSNKYKPGFPDLKAYVPAYETSDKIDGLCAKRDKTTDHKWRKGREETTETVKAMEAKKKRIRLNTSKGTYQYFADTGNREELKIHVK